VILPPSPTLILKSALLFGQGSLRNHLFLVLNHSDSAPNWTGSTLGVVGSIPSAAASKKAGNTSYHCASSTLSNIDFKISPLLWTRQFKESSFSRPTLL
jgi:hypothetical protein